MTNQNIFLHPSPPYTPLFGSPAYFIGQAKFKALFLDTFSQSEPYPSVTNKTLEPLQGFFHSLTHTPPTEPNPSPDLILSPV